MSILDSATDVLRLMASTQSELTMTDLVGALGMPKSSASRVLKHMTEVGLLVRNPTSLAYRPSLLLLELSHLVRSTTPLIEMCQQALEALGREFGQTGYVSLLDGNDVLVLHVRPGTQALRAMTHPGYRVPSWATSTGRSLLARESNDAIRKRFAAVLPMSDSDKSNKPDEATASSHLKRRSEAAPEEPQTALPGWDVVSVGGPQTIDQLCEVLDVVRAQRYAIAESEALAGICSIGCAVGDPVSAETLSFCLSFPAGVYSAEQVEHMAISVRSRAASIASAIGDTFWSGPRGSSASATSTPIDSRSDAHPAAPASPHSPSHSY